MRCPICGRRNEDTIAELCPCLDGFDAETKQALLTEMYEYNMWDPRPDTFDYAELPDGFQIERPLIED